MNVLVEIRKRRLALGVSLGELARAVGRSDATLSRIERGKIRPSYELVQRILKYLEEQEGLAAPRLTVRDVMNRTVVTADASSTLHVAARRMEGGAFSQLPVLADGKVVGSLSEGALLRALGHPRAQRIRVREILEPAYPLVDEEFPAELLPGLFAHYPAVLVTRRGDLKGIVTKADLIRGLHGTSLRRTPPA
ncbi:MAG: CBS domain-containing protein [Thermoplasmata archaeon]